jgi:ubiquitin-conjugating enzyme (huntingtin interacting protein 2)
MDTNRLAKELREIAADTKSGVTVTVLGDNLAHMQGTLQGASRNGAHTEPLARSRSPHLGHLAMLLFGSPFRTAFFSRPARNAVSRLHAVSRSVSRLTSFPFHPSNPTRIFSGAGPEESPYEGGVFYVDIQLTDAYPFEPPKMRFMTKVWHPNVSSANGAICLDILKEQWSPALSIKTAMLSLQALLSSPEPSDPQDAVVARQYMDNLEEFNAQAKRWTKEYAAAGAKDEKLERLKEMGFAENAVRAALGRAAGDEQQALELLLTGI